MSLDSDTYVYLREAVENVDREEEHDGEVLSSELDRNALGSMV